MLLTITTSHTPATDIGFLLEKHPGKVHEFELSAGRALMFYAEATDARCTAALMLDVDPIGLRAFPGREGRRRWPGSIRQRSTVRGLVIPERRHRYRLQVGDGRQVTQSPRTGGDSDPS